MGANNTQSEETEACIPLTVFLIIEASTFIVIIIIIIATRVYERHRTAKRIVEGRFGHGGLRRLNNFSI
jgi:hypothetical protein